MIKRLLLVTLLFCSVSFTQAQSLRIGAEGAFNSTWLFCKTVSDQGSQLDYKPTWDGQYGISGLYTFKDVAGIEFGILSGHVNQKYTNRIIVGNVTLKTYETEAKVSYIDIPLMYRYTSQSGPYFEVGPQFSFLSGYKYTNDLNGASSTDTKNVNSINISLQIGFGYDVKLDDKWTILMGLRFGYGLTDAGKKPSGAQNYEATNSAVGGLRFGVAYNIFGGEGSNAKRK